jgi:hypothetical protein
VYLVDLSETEESRCARSEGIGKSYASRILRLALLARDIVEAILSRADASGADAGAAGPAAAASWEEERERLLSARTS